MRSSLVLLKGARALPDHETPRLRFLGSRARGLLAGLLLLSTCAESSLTAQEARDLPVSMVAPDWRSLDEFVENTRIQYRVPGVSVVIVKDDQVVLLKGYGVREIQKAAPVDADTVFRLASVSKVFTATSAATLVEKGKIKWDQPLVELLPDLRLINDQAGGQASLRDCLAHRVGFSPASGAFLEAMGFTRKEFVSRLQHFQMPGAFREHAAYSSVGYFIAGEALSQISGQPVEDFVTQSVLSPLGMHRTTTWLPAEQQQNWSARHATLQGQIQAIDTIVPSLMDAAQGFCSSARDMAPFLRMMLAQGRLGSRQILQEETVEALFTPVIPATPTFSEQPPIGTETGFSFTPGWGVYHYGGRRILEKGGALDGVRVCVTLVPAERLGVAIFANLNLTILPEAIRARVLQHSLHTSDGPPVQQALLENDRLISSLIAPPSWPAHPKAPQQPLQACHGVYESPLYGTWTVEPGPGDGAQATLKIKAGPAQWQLPARHWDGDTFVILWPVVNSLPDEMTFQFTQGSARASGFIMDGSQFLRRP